MTDRPYHDRRKSERRRAPKRNVHPVVFFALGAFLTATGAWVYYESSHQTADHKLARSRQQEAVKSGNANYDRFVASVKQRDEDLRDKLKERRESRKTNIDSIDARRHYEHRLAELESDLEMHKEFADQKGSIGWDLKQQIKKMKEDPPPE